jgi:hypothetical protein
MIGRQTRFSKLENRVQYLSGALILQSLCILALIVLNSHSISTSEKALEAAQKAQKQASMNVSGVKATMDTVANVKARQADTEAKVRTIKGFERFGLDYSTVVSEMEAKIKDMRID